MRVLPVILLAMIMAPVHAQFRLSGCISGLEGGSVTIRVPFVYDFFAQDPLEVPVEKDGSFAFRFPLEKEKLVRLEYGRKAVLVFARPGQSLVVNNDNADGRVMPAGGSLFGENKVLFDADPLEYPGFIKAPPPRDSLAAQAPDMIYTTYIRPWMQHAQEKAAAIEKTALSPRLKQLFIQETRSAAYCRAGEFAQDFMNMKQLTVFYERLYRPVSPASAVRDPGPFYYWFVNGYNGYLESQAMSRMKASGNKPNAPLQYYNVSIDSGTVLIRQKGKAYINWLAIKNTNSPEVAEAYLAQQVFTRYTEKDLKYAGALLEVLRTTYPTSAYYHQLKNNVHELEQLLARNRDNKVIQILANYDSVQSIYPVIHSLKGKVVYLDVWGTWCGPCKHELKFTPQLKQRFKDKEVAFVYLDMDEDDRDAIWKQFIKVNGLTGVHLRKNRAQMASFWKELLANADDKSEYYPQYFIFDREGNLVVAKAERPSKKEALYQQIESVLNVSP